MSFTRYEIRWTTHRCFYEGGDAMTYAPFDTLAQARAYINAHKDECKSTSTTTCAIYKVTLYSTYEATEEIERL